MVRHDYELIARVIKDDIHYQSLRATPARTKIITEILTNTAYRMSGKLAVDNKAFDRELFLKNCGIGE